MKMEVLSVQNQYQGQFGVIGSSKVKDWTSPLTAPTHGFEKRSNSSAKQLQKPEPAAQQEHSSPQTNNTQHSINSQESGDVVDGLQPHQHYHHSHNRRASPPTHPPHHPHYHPTMEAATAVEDSTAAARYAYNNNLLLSGPESGSSAIAGSLFGSALIDDIDAAAVNELSQRLQAELRAAKSRHLACTEVTLPWDLTPRIAAEIIRTSEREPCGVRGGTIFIEFEDEPNNTRRIASFKVDPNTVSTFELYLTLKHDKSGWTSLLPQFLKNLARSSTILISPDFTLTKNKLYSCE